MRLTRAQNVLRLAGNVQNRVDFWGGAPDPAEGAYDAPSDSLVVRGFLPSAIAASRLRRLQFPVFGGEIASITQGGSTPLLRDTHQSCLSRPAQSTYIPELALQ